MIGYANIRLDALHEWIDEDREQAKNKENWEQANWSNYFYSHQTEFKSCSHIISSTSYHFTYDESKEFDKLLDSLHQDGLKIQVFYHDDFATVVGYENHRYIIPSEFVDIEYLEDYSDYSVSDLKALSDNEVTSSMMPAELSSSSLNSLKNDLDEKKKEIAAAEEECNKAIEEVRRELKRKEEELRELLNQKTEELRLKKESLEKQILVLDTQIYSIRCYLGEVISFTKIRDGSPAKIDEPVVLFQKIRYLDEELGKYASLFDWDSQDHETFASILKHREDIADIFCPRSKSISIVRSSRTGTYKGASEFVTNVLSNYSYLHGKQLAILVRNGGNLYIGWADDDKITLSNENVFFANKVTVEPASAKSDSLWDEDKRKKEEAVDQSDRISRYFLLSILQGILDRNDMIEFPEKISIFKESDYIKFSYAEGWLQDFKYGSFKDILDKSKDVEVKVGDSIYTALNIGRDDIRDYRSRYSAYSNDRGIGYKNRTHDACINGLEFMKINKVLRTLTVDVEFNIYKADPIEDTTRYFKYDHATPYYCKRSRSNEILEHVVMHDVSLTDVDSIKQGLLDQHSGKLWSTIKEDGEVVGIDSRHDGQRYSDLPDLTQFGIPDDFSYTIKNIEYVKTYVSVPIDPSDSSSRARCNFEISDDEYIRTNFLCSTWIKWVIQSGHIGGWRLAGSTMSYADSLIYLKNILSFVQKQEEKDKLLLEKAGLSSWIDSNPEWDRILCEWKIDNAIHELGARSSKQFAKFLNV